MTREMQELVEHQDFTSADLQQLTTNGVMSSFAPLDLKLDLLDRISQAYSS